MSEQRETPAEEALRRVMRWFECYPGFIPNHDRIDQCCEDIAFAKQVLAGRAPAGGPTP